ncbi:MAG: HlyD family secretion protein [Bacteroidales bacterium]|jgi:HlyD family secretion protein|nr:HlyD family secretion protein [Bacteroidales bacterium]
MNDNIELRSEEVQEILGKPPGWMVRWGITLIFIIVAGLFIGSYFFKYPDILNATITVTTENLPAGVTAKTSGKIDTLFVTEKQTVKAGEMLAYIDNPANLADVLALKGAMEKAEKQKVKGKMDIGTDSALLHCCSSAFLPSVSLGELQSAYLPYVKACEDWDYFVQADYHHKKIQIVEKQIATQKAILSKSQRQLELSRKQITIAEHLFRIDSTLYAGKYLSLADYETAKNNYFQQLQTLESTKISLDNQKMSILQSEQSVFDLQQQCVEQENSLKIALTAAQDQLLAQLKIWEQTYLLVAPTNGVVTFTKFWQQNQNINAGEVLVTVVPQAKTKIMGKILLPPQGAGKVKEGQTVNVKLDNFPYMEYGMIRVAISKISLVPIEVGEGKKMYLLEVLFPEQLITNYGKQLTFSQEMTGTAEIITEDLRLIDKFINPIKAVFKK